MLFLGDCDQLDAVEAGGMLAALLSSANEAGLIGPKQTAWLNACRRM